jgi:hypothetical protein
MFDRVASRDICTGMVASRSDPLTGYSRWNQQAQTTKPGDVMHLPTHAKVDLGPFRDRVAVRYAIALCGLVSSVEGLVEVSA